MKQRVELLVRNCGQLLTLRKGGKGPRRGAALADLGLVEDGAVAAAGGRIVAAGDTREVETLVQPGSGCVEVDAGGAVVMPGFVDCHTHTVFADYRLSEYVQRVSGVPYAEIARGGGGIAKSVADLRKMEETALFDTSVRRLSGCLRHGTTTVEIKSGYGLDLNHEMKQLRVAKRLADRGPALVVSTFLGAHAVPPEYAGRRDEYVEIVAEEMIPAVATAGLAEFNDVFSETGVFTVDEAERILRAGQKVGLRARVHADELNDTGSARMAVRIGAVSADHLTKIGPTTIREVAASGTAAVLLPGTSFGLPSMHFAPARALVDAGAAVAIATDFNPGSSPSESMPMMIAIACSHMGLLPEEAITAATINPAYVLGREDAVGSLQVGKRADLLILDCADYREIPYRFGVNPVHRVFVEGSEWKDGSVGRDA